MEAKLFSSRLAILGPSIQTSAAERFRLKAKLFFSSRPGCGAFGPAVAGVRDSVRRLPDVPRGSAEDSRDELRATSSGCRGRSGDIPDLLRASVGDSQRGDGVGTPVGCRQFAVDDMEKEEKHTCSRDSSRSGARRLLRDFRVTNL
jgi:hypothetical protein